MLCINIIPHIVRGVEVLLNQLSCTQLLVTTGYNKLNMPLPHLCTTYIGTWTWCITLVEWEQVLINHHWVKSFHFWCLLSLLASMNGSS